MMIPLNNGKIGDVEVKTLPFDEEIIVGGDKDEHGCIPSAGYTWCEAKKKCLRTWEEPCYRNVTSFTGCVEFGGPVMESYPRKCSINGETFVEELCESDTDCETPMEYLIRSSCPFQAACKDGVCTVICPFDNPDTVPELNPEGAIFMCTAYQKTTKVCTKEYMWIKLILKRLDPLKLLLTQLNLTVLKKELTTNGILF